MRAKTLGTWLVAAALPPLALGCGHLETRRVAFDRPARSGVVVFASREPASGEELGTVVARGGEGVGDNDVRELYTELVRQTKALGGNALVIESMTADLKSEPPVRTLESTMNDPCGAGCTDETGLRARDETMTVELRGKALRLSPDELGKAPARRAP